MNRKTLTSQLKRKMACNINHNPPDYTIHVIFYPQAIKIYLIKSKIIGSGH